MIQALLYFVIKAILSLLMLAIVSGYIYRLTSRDCKSRKRLDGKTVLITGGTAGIGKVTARDLVSRGARVIIGCRDLRKGENLKECIGSKTQCGEVVIKYLDLSDLHSVRKFANDIKSNEEKIDILINNAALGSNDKRKSPQGYELTYATNHLGHFLLTNMLLNKLTKNAGSRIVTVSSVAHMCNPLVLDDIHFKRRYYTAWKAYCQSKICNILFATELSRRLKDTGVTSNCLHPGLIGTDIYSKGGGLQGILFQMFFNWFGKTVEQGAQTTIYLAVSDEVEGVTGKYFTNCKSDWIFNGAADPNLAAKLWNIGEHESELTQTDLD